MSDGPSKLAPADASSKRDADVLGDAPALDDIILGEDDQTVPTPPVHVRTASKMPPVADATQTDTSIEDRPSRRSSNRVKAADGPSDTRKRAKMTLRIPDDEISRPQLPATTPTGGIPAIGMGLSGTSPSRPPGSTLEQRIDSRPPPPHPSRPPSSPDYPPVKSADRASAGAPLRPQPIVSVGSADDTLELPAVDLEARGASAGARAAGIDATQEAGWTPYQPTVADRAASEGRSDLGAERIMTRGHDAAAAAAAQAAMREPARTMVDDPSRRRADDPREVPSAPPESEDIPIDTDDDGDNRDVAIQDRRDRSDELLTMPRLPSSLDSEDIKVDDGERHTDPGEVSDEIDPADLVSVESIPRPHSGHSPPPLKGGKPSLSPPPPVVVTATQLMAGVGPSGSSLGMPAPLAITAPMGVAQVGTPHHPPGIAVSPLKAPSVPPGGVPSYVPAQVQANQSQPPVASQPQAQPQARDAGHPRDSAETLGLPPQPPHLELSSETPAAGTPMARRQQPAGGPFGFMPQVGALAPPPMNEAAANRKKTRPWWEDLFNDDFIRTMAKITDGDIAREANFIEESLGCEAGATILDLACGTGRHAVELAARGYQVVGFDLSLAMLARASDEAQDRRQKINFVQGDMREMTFEETFDGVFSWNTSFGFFDEEKNAAVIAKVHRALKKGGQFLLDVVNRDSLVRSAPSLAWFEGDGCICMDEMQIDFITSRMKVKRTLMMDDGRTKEIEYSIRVYSLHELGKMLHDNGFRVAEVSGRTGTPGVFFGCESPRTLILAEKR